MSPMTHLVNITDVCFPRVSGDEPSGKLRTTGMSLFSPRERG